MENGLLTFLIPSQDDLTEGGEGGPMLYIGQNSKDLLLYGSDHFLKLHVGRVHLSPCVIQYLCMIKN